VECIQLFQSTFQQLDFVDVGKTLDFKLNEILNFSSNILHLKKSYIERWLSHGESSDNCTNPHWINL
jgi:hypothetical protein